MITIRPAVDGDVEAVGDLHHVSRAAAYAGIVPADALAAYPGPLMAEWWRERLRYEGATHRLHVAATDGGEVVGFSYVGPAPEPATGELYAIHVRPDRLGSGIGRRLIGHAREALVGLGAGRAVLWVLAGNVRARRFYERDGWLADGVRREGPIGPVVTEQLRYVRALQAGYRPGEST